MDLRRLQQDWTQLGAADPLWAILGSAESKGRPWDVDAFFATGTATVQWIGAHLAGLGLDLPRDHTVLDFGCGYGRLTQALAEHFAQVVGVDLAPTMLEGARRFNRHGERCRYVLNERPDLRCFPDASFGGALSLLVLQHMEPLLILGYVRELLRVLEPGGLAFFQVPAERMRSRSAGAPSAATPARGRMPHAALASSLVVHPDFLDTAPACWLHVLVQVQNRGSAVWCAAPGPGRVQIAARWQQPGAPAGAIRCFDLPHDLRPGDALQLALPLRAPAEPGDHRAVFLVVQDGRWIQALHCGAGQALVRVLPAPPEQIAAALARPEPPPFQAAPAPREPSGPPVIEVHGVPVTELCDCIEAAGGEVLDVGEDHWGGPGWLSAHYTVRRR